MMCPPLITKIILLYQALEKAVVTTALYLLSAQMAY
jgi:hypothetical protein